MGIVNKIIIAVALFSLVFGLVSVSEASTSLVINSLDVIYDGSNTYGEVYMENTGTENITALVVVHIDGLRTGGTVMDFNVRYFYGFQIQRVKSFEFDVIEEQGNHKIVVSVIAQRDIIQKSVEYRVDEPVEEYEDEVEEEGDWLQCP